MCSKEAFLFVSILYMYIPLFKPLCVNNYNIICFVMIDLHEQNMH